MGNDAMSKVLSASLHGIDTEIITVETDLTAGLPNFSLVGLPGSAVRESKERVRAAIVNSGYDFPLRRITVNLSPADTRKEGSHLDLPIAVGILAGAARGAADRAVLGKTAFLGELSLDGSIGRMELAAAMVLGLQDGGVENVFLPAANLPDVTELPGMVYYPVTQLSEVIEHVLGEFPVQSVRGGERAAARCGAAGPEERAARDFFEVKGQERIKRALLISVAGRHDISMVGPPGIGKSMLARRVPGIMPTLTETESREVTRLHNIAGETQIGSGLIRERPFRAPHHSATQAAIVGGGRRPGPGELSLAHRGVLFLDELPEFERRTLDMLRQPLEDRHIDLSRVGFKGRYPCDFLLICAMNPCPCGYDGDPARECRCSPAQRQRYLSRMSGPLMDRIDIHVRMGAVGETDLDTGAAQEDCMDSADMRALVKRAGDAQRERAGGGELYNARIADDAIARICVMEPDAEHLLRNAYAHYALSVRARTKIVKVARTIADIEGCERIQAGHMAEAISYRAPARGGSFGGI
ncbi:MAG: YifB family Mg chelatase-like AAA ATPase [Clostridiales Family XIII bacterium]|jgi:magnesium chelatase family protein|nr:YifB family Mg chelatase-like AAA ATPase [Clostridiales Family XIII bacterium]